MAERAKHQIRNILLSSNDLYPKPSQKRNTPGQSTFKRATNTSFTQEKHLPPYLKTSMPLPKRKKNSQKPPATSHVRPWSRRKSPSAAADPPRPPTSRRRSGRRPWPAKASPRACKSSSAGAGWEKWGWEEGKSWRIPWWLSLRSVLGANGRFMLAVSRDDGFHAISGGLGMNLYRFLWSLYLWICDSSSP